jgi:aryl carrier-like protein
MQAMKVDRKKLRANAMALSLTDLGSFTADTRIKVEPTTDREFALRDVWAQVLGVPADNIGKHDKFLQIGGDSISAIKLASMAQSKGFGITVANIFKDSSLSSMALVSGTKYETLDVDPFSQVSSEVISAVMGEVEKFDDLEKIHGIEDISPTHVTQDSFIAASTKFPGTLMARRVFRIPEHVEVERFRAAWDSMVQHFSILRSRIYLVEGESYLAALKEVSEWEDVKGLDVREYVKVMEKENMTYGSRLHRQAIIEEDGAHYFVWIQHHAIADGWTFGLFMNALEHFFKDMSPPPAGQYAGFVKFARNIDADRAAHFWAQHLQGAEQTTWPPPLAADTPYKGGVTQTLSRGIQLPSMDASITPATIMTGAWALALSQRDNRSDVCFTRTSSGRQAPLEGLETVAGLTTARVPVRVQIDNTVSISQFLSDIQTTAAESVPFEHYGSKNIAKLLPEAAASAVLQPTSLLLLQPAKHLNIETSEENAIMVPTADKISGAEALDGFYIMPLVTDCFLGDDRIDLHSAYNKHVLEKVEVEAFHEELERLISHLCTHSGEVVSSAFSA